MDSCIVDYVKIQRMFNDKEVTELSEYVINHKLSIKEIKYDVFEAGRFPIFWEDVTDTILGILYERI